MKNLFLIFILLLSYALHAQVDLGYQKPNKAILDLVDVPLPPRVSMNSKGDKALLMFRNSFKSIEELSQVEMRLAGLRINPKTNIGSRTRFMNNIKLLDVKSKKEIEILGIPKGAQIANIRWSPDESTIAFTISQNESTKLWVLDVQSAKTKELISTLLNANMGTPFSWRKDSKSLIVKALPKNKSTLINKASTIPTGPTISENFGKKAQNRTYQDLLKDKTDEQNFSTLASSELMQVDLDGNQSPWLPKAIYRSISSSPDGNYYIISTVEKPFSYLVPYYRFPSKTSVYNKNGDLIKVLLEVPLIEDLPKGFDAVRLGKRNIQWREDKPSTIVWVEALDGGNPSIDVTHRDAVFEQHAPFDGPHSKLIETENRFRYIDWCDENTAIAHDRKFNDRNVKTYLFDPANPSKESTILQDRNYQDRYSDPGDFVTEKNQYGEETVAKINGKLYLIGDGYSDDGVLPFIDEYDVKTHKTKRIYRAKKNNKLEKIIDVIDLKSGTFLTSIESNNDYPNYFKRNLKSGNKLTEITNFKNPFASISEVHKEVINYKRDDGLDLSGTLYLPPGYDRSSGEKLPMILWAYPIEYKDKSSASQITSSPNAFTYPSYGSPIFWVTRGFAVLDRAAFPIVGEGDSEPNDSFRKQLVANGLAAIDAVDALGYIDREKVGVGGHSYGAFMVANLLSHSNDYAAGIARSGAYNRTLTPFGFQREQRSYWEAPEVYYTMSPFMHADKMKTPLLLIHGEADNNSGTYPMQSERYFNALKGLGATTRLVMLPKESHGYSAKESVLHMLWEQDQWLEKHVKNKSAKKELIRP